VYLGVVEGDKVKAGQIIARLDDRDIVAQLDEAKSSLQLYKAQMNEVENNYNREKELFSRGLSSQQSLDQQSQYINHCLRIFQLLKQE